MTAEGEREGPFQRRMMQFSVTLALLFAVSNPSGCSINPHLIDTNIVRKGTDIHANSSSWCMKAE